MFKTLQPVWTSYRKAHQSLPSSSPSPALVETKSSLGGVASLMKKMETTNLQNKQTMNEAFQDLESLMSKANEMVQLAAQLNSRLMHDKESSEMAELRTSLAQLGLMTMLSK